MNEKDNKTYWEDLDEREVNEILLFGDEYINFLNKCKTERESSKYIIEALLNKDFKDICDVSNLKIGDKVYYNNRNKSVYAIKIGENIIDGLNIIASHIDSPRLDLKPNSLYEDTSLAYLKTHYYGGIKKYQWTTIPLILKGVVFDKNMNKIEVNIGEDKQDPIFTITDLLPHLSKRQNQKKLIDAIEGENLNVLVGSISKNSSVKENIINILKEKYKIEINDLNCSELSLVPAFRAKTLGFDKSMVAAYGQDDKACTYPLLKSFIEDSSNQTVCAIFTDKEEIGSVGNTGMYSSTFDYFLNMVLDKLNINKPGLLNHIFNNSKMLSADVGAGYDSNYKDAFDKLNSSIIGFGIEINKYTGSSGKSGASDASAEYLSYIKNLFQKNNIKYQISELGKIDEGGGGTIAYILANKGVEVLDCGVALLSMHSPYEVVSLYDVFTLYKAYKTFFQEKFTIKY